MKLTWLTDIHLNFLNEAELTTFIGKIKDENSDAILISGDIGESTNLKYYLQYLEQSLKLPIYFVLGNHDYYDNSIKNVRNNVKKLAADSDYLVYLTDSEIIQLSDNAAIIGHDGWADGQNGDYNNSDVFLNDYILIEEFREKIVDEDFQSNAAKKLRLEIMSKLAEEAASHFENILSEALEKCDKVFVLTHVPPFRESCWYDGSISDNNFLPHFSNRMVGDVLESIMADSHDKYLTVLCGHTHGSGKIKILDNLEVITGGAVYRNAEIQMSFFV